MVTQLHVGRWSNRPPKVFKTRMARKYVVVQLEMFASSPKDQRETGQEAAIH